MLGKPIMPEDLMYSDERAEYLYQRTLKEKQRMNGPEKIQDIQNAARITLDVLQDMGEDITRSGLVNTPHRVSMAFMEMFEGYSMKVEDIITTFDDVKCDEMIVLKDIEFFSTCEHHMMPFHGKAHIAYIPKGRVIGISKLARILDVFAKRLQIQERIGEQVTEALMQHLEPLGAACIIEAKHLCMMMRGVEKQNSEMITSSMVGVFRDKPEVRAEFTSLLGRSK
jgi:GTP cyclohydrolase IA